MKKSNKTGLIILLAVVSPIIILGLIVAGSLGIIFLSGIGDAIEESTGYSQSDLMGTWYDSSHQTYFVLNEDKTIEIYTEDKNHLYVSGTYTIEQDYENEVGDEYLITVTTYNRVTEGKKLTDKYTTKFSMVTEDYKQSVIMNVVTYNIYYMSKISNTSSSNSSYNYNTSSSNSSYNYNTTSSSNYNNTIGNTTSSDKYSSNNNSNSVTITTNYTKNDIENKFISNSKKYSIDEINSTNLDKFNELLNYVDNMVGKYNYKIHSIYPSSIGRNNSYIVKIVLNEYISQYNNYGNDSDNPYIIMITKDESEGKYNNHYYSFKLAMAYRNDLMKELKNLNSKYGYELYYNTLLYINEETFGVTENSKWEDILANYASRTNNNLPNLYIIGDSSQSIDSMESFVKNNMQVFKKYHINAVNIFQLKEGSKMTNFEGFNQFDSSIKEKKGISIK